MTFQSGGTIGPASIHVALQYVSAMSPYIPNAGTRLFDREGPYLHVALLTHGLVVIGLVAVLENNNYPKTNKSSKIFATAKSSRIISVP